MAPSKGQEPGDVGLVFAAHDNHDERCGQPPRLRNSDNPGLYYGDFENRYGERFVFTFDRVARAGTISGGDLGWGEPKSFAIEQLEEAVRDTRRVAAPIAGRRQTETSGRPVIDAALALGRVTGLTGRDEVIWLRACLEACATFTQ
jgi:hypothetical protein